MSHLRGSVNSEITCEILSVHGRWQVGRGCKGLYFIIFQKVETQRLKNTAEEEENRRAKKKKKSKKQNTRGPENGQALERKRKNSYLT